MNVFPAILLEYNVKKESRLQYYSLCNPEIVNVVNT